MIVATAGHIDHGKTTLVKALTGVDTDRLPEEKKRGISIDIGFAYRKTAAGDIIGFVDVPGHERFVRNMLAGVCGIDYVMLIVAADDGVMPQTVEHLHIVDLLTVRRGIAVITKTDRVPAERVAEVAASVRALLAPTALAGIDVLPVSAISGEGVEQLRDALASAAREHGTREHAGRNLRYAIDRVFTIAGSGTVVTGTVFNGAVAIGDKLMLTPSGIEVRVRGIQKDGQAAQQAKRRDFPRHQQQYGRDVVQALVVVYPVGGARGDRAVDNPPQRSPGLPPLFIFPPVRKRPQRPLHVAFNDGRVAVGGVGERGERGQVAGVGARAQEQGPGAGAQRVGPQAAHAGHFAQGGEVELKEKQGGGRSARAAPRPAPVGRHPPLLAPHRFRVQDGRHHGPRGSVPAAVVARPFGGAPCGRRHRGTRGSGVAAWI